MSGRLSVSARIVGGLGDSNTQSITLRGRIMNYRSRFVALTLLNAALMLPLTCVLGAEGAVDPAVGTWTLDLAKSKQDPNEPALKSSVRTYTATADGLKVSIHNVDVDGAAHDTGSTFTYDGKPHPVTGPTDYDTIAVTRVSTNESKAKLIKSGKVIGHLTRVISKDGKTMTITVNDTNAKGAKIHDVTVFKRQ
jgi:hypothetical protein